MWSIVYNGLVFPIIWLLAQIAALTNQKLRESFKGKKGLWQRLEQQLQNRDPSQPLAWIHVASAGEFLQVQLVLERLLNDGVDCAVTFNSISGIEWTQKRKIYAHRQPIIIDYLPYDFPFSVKRWIKRVDPDVLILVKYDLWPNTIWQAHQATIPIYLVSATLQPKTLRFTSALGRSLYGNLYSHFQGIFAVTEDDKKRFLQTRSDLTTVEVVGDTRFDSTIAQRDRIPMPDLPRVIHQSRVFIVGSCWPADEACIFPVLKEALAVYSDLFLIIAPHEPTKEHLQNSDTYFKDFKRVRFSALDQCQEEDPRILLVDTVGNLSSIYRAGDVGYVGGGFTTGVHNVMEPCSLGIPVFFGPIHYNSPEAVHLAGAGLAFPVETSAQYREKLFDLLEHPELARELGSRAQNYIESQGGATERCYQVISQTLNDRSLQRKTA